MSISLSEFISQRISIANALLGTFDFTSQVEAIGGWEYSSPGCELSIKVYIQPLPESATFTSEAVTFTVVFESTTSTVVKTSYAINKSGVIFGRQA